MNEHLRRDRISLEYHREVAVRLACDPAVREAARGRLDRWVANGVMHGTYSERWRALLDLPLADLCEALKRDDDEMQAMRQTSPFAGTLTPRERWALRRSVGQEFDRGGFAATESGER